MKTHWTRVEDLKQKQWYIVDAKDKILGRLAVKLAEKLMGKDKPSYTPSVDDGAGIIVINATGIRFTGRKAMQKEYKNYSGYPGGQRVRTLGKMMEENPVYVIRHAVKGMLPKNKLGSAMISRLRVYKSDKYDERAQNPVALEV